MRWQLGWQGLVLAIPGLHRAVCFSARACSRRIRSTAAPPNGCSRPQRWRRRSPRALPCTFPSIPARIWASTSNNGWWNSQRRSASATSSSGPPDRSSKWARYYDSAGKLIRRLCRQACGTSAPRARSSSWFNGRRLGWSGGKFPGFAGKDHPASTRRSSKPSCSARVAMPAFHSPALEGPRAIKSAISTGVPPVSAWPADCPPATWTTSVLVMPAALSAGMNFVNSVSNGRNWPPSGSPT